MFGEVLKLIEKFPGFEVARDALLAVEKKLKDQTDQILELLNRANNHDQTLAALDTAHTGHVANLEKAVAALQSRVDQVSSALGDFKLVASELGKNPGEVAGPATTLGGSSPLQPFGLRVPPATPQLQIDENAPPCPDHPDADQTANGCTEPGCTWSGKP